MTSAFAAPDFASMRAKLPAATAAQLDVDGFAVAERMLPEALGASHRSSDICWLCDEPGVVRQTSVVSRR